MAVGTSSWKTSEFGSENDHKQDQPVTAAHKHIRACDSCAAVVELATLVHMKTEGTLLQVLHWRHCSLRGVVALVVFNNKEAAIHDDFTPIDSRTTLEISSEQASRQDTWCQTVLHERRRTTKAIRKHLHTKHVFIPTTKVAISTLAPLLTA